MKRWKFLATVSVVVLAALATACGGSSTSGEGLTPTAPSSPSTPAATTGASISGVVTGLATGSGAGAVGARNAVTVTIVGTNITTTVDASGNFTINNVPPGNVTLSFSGTSATVTIQNVGQSGKVKVVIVVSGSTATLETLQQTENGKTELEGRISSFGTTPNTFFVGNVLVTAPGADAIRHGDTLVPFANLKVGDRVHVTGTPGGTELAPTLAATLVNVQNINPNVPVNLKGAISELNGTCSGATFKVEGWKVEAGSAAFDKGCTTETLKNGANVHVKGDVIPATTAPAAPAYVKADWVKFTK